MTTTKAQPTLEDLEDDVQKELQQQSVYRWLVVAGSGVGKSSFINKLVGREVCKVGAGLPVSQGFQEVRVSESLIMYDSKGMEKGQNREDYLKDLRQFLSTQKSKNEAIDALAVMVTNRIEEGFELYLLNEIELTEIPTVVLLLHKCDINYHDSISIQAQIQKKEISIPGHVRVFLTSTQDQKLKPAKCSTETCRVETPSFVYSGRSGAWKCEDCNATIPALLCHQNDQLVDYVIASTTDQRKRIALLRTIPVRGRGYKIAASVPAIAAGVAVNATIAATPIPFSDWPFMIGSEVAMIAALAAIWGMNINKSRIGVFVIAILGSVGLPALLGLSLGKGVASLLKFIPVFGSLAGAALDVAVSGIITTLVGVVACVALATGDLTNEHLATKELAIEAIRKRVPTKLLEKLISEVKKGRPVDEILNDVIPAEPK